MDEIIEAYERFSEKWNKDGQIQIYRGFYKDLELILSYVDFSLNQLMMNDEKGLD